MLARLRPHWLWHGVNGALLAAFFVTVLGNLDGGGQVLRALASRAGSSFESGLPGVQTAVRAAAGLVEVLGPQTLPPYNYWAPSRVIPATINEFPYWSFLFADLHPHLMGIPFTVLFLALAYNLLSNGLGSGPGSSARQRALMGLSLGEVARFLVLALVLGALAVINTWDLPTYFGLALLVRLVQEWRGGRWAQGWLPILIRTGLFGLALLGLAVAFYLPFFRHYAPVAASGVGWVRAQTDLGQWLNIWGFLGLLAVTFVAVELRRRPVDGARQDLGLLRWLRLALNSWTRLPRLLTRLPRSASNLLALALPLGLAILLWLLGLKVLALLSLPLLAIGLLLLRRGASAENSFVTVLVFTALLVLAGVEVFFLKDHLQGGDYYRMNTLFKFYIQVWTMLALAGGVALPRILSFLRQHWSRGWRGAWLVGFGWLLLLSMVFPLAGTPARLQDRFPAQNGRPALGTLDGMAFMEAGTYTWHPDPAQAANTSIVLRYDYEALRWLLDNVQGTPVVAEAVTGYYREGGLRVASFTGFPTLLGFHQEGEQRYGWQTGPRRGKAEEFWNSTDLARAQALAAELAVDYIYVGQLERILYSQESLAKFPALEASGLLEVVYSNEQVVIYRVL